MSKVQTRRDIAAENVELESKLNEARAAVDTVKAEMEQAQAALVEQHNAALAAITVERDEAQAKITEIEAKLTEQSAALEAEQAARAEVESAKAEIEAAKVAAEADLEKAKAALVNPAVADASINAPGQTPNATLDAEADEAEKAAVAKTEQESKVKHYEEYCSLRDSGNAKAARTYWRENEQSIINEQRNA